MITVVLKDKEITMLGAWKESRHRFATRSGEPHAGVEVLGDEASFIKTEYSSQETDLKYDIYEVKNGIVL